MATQTPVDIGTLIVSTPGIVGGRPRITGTRLYVHLIGSLYREGMTPEEMLAEYRSDIPLSHYHAAIAYYLANREQIDAEIAEDDEAYDRAAAESLRAGGGPPGR
ncbi:MAG: DUF433 domain-containing protein [Dehalococcoidia bacterium]|nr:DUF433 domain-containing protein [Dehalococcoidia bacterium]